MKRVVYFGALVLAAMLISTNVPAQSEDSSGKYPNKFEGKAKISCEYEAKVVFGHNVDLADNYLTQNIVVHHDGFPDIVGMAQEKAALSKMKAPAPASGGCGGATVVIAKGDYVVLLRTSETPDPQDKTKMISHNHHYIWRFEGNKMAEHWY